MALSYCKGSEEVGDPAPVGSLTAEALGRRDAWCIARGLKEEQRKEETLLPVPKKTRK